MNQLISRPSSLAITAGAIVFGILYWFSSFGLSAFINWWFYPSPPHDMRETIISSWQWSVFSFAIYLIPGFVAGLLARRSGLMHGAIIGLLTVPIMAAFIYAAGFWQFVAFASFFYGLMLALFWCTFAGLLGEVIASKVWPQ